MPIKISKYGLPNFSEIKRPTCPIKAADMIINKPKIKVTFDILISIFKQLLCLFNPLILYALPVFEPLKILSGLTKEKLHYQQDIASTAFLPPDKNKRATYTTSLHNSWQILSNLSAKLSTFFLMTS